MATALNGLIHLIPFVRAFSTGSRLAFGGTVAATENNAATPTRRHADTSFGAWRRYLLGTEIERAERRR
jgi:hypothetical protein